MKKIACLLNSPELGGAERSFITQLSMLDKSTKYDLFYPRLGTLESSQELRKLVQEKLPVDLKGFEYVESLYEKSRTSKFDLIFSLLNLFYQSFLFKIEGFYKYSALWCNGNKVFYPAVIGAILFGYRGKILWHLRDYPTPGFLNKFISFLVLKFSKFELILIANSESVASAYSVDFSSFNIHRAYNPVEDVDFVKENTSLKVIGFAGMSAPWKGLHELYLWASLYEEDLREMGVEEIAVFGKNIYHTKGEHLNYAQEINRLSKIFPSSLIVKKGLVPPKEIFSSIDLMLHLSVQKEPFGRVILESFSYGVPCFSTALGGSKELMINLPELVHFPYDYGGLTEKLKSLTENKTKVAELRSRGLSEYKNFQSLAISDLKTLETTYFQ